VAGRLADAATTYLATSLGLKELNPRVVPLLSNPPLFFALQALAGLIMGFTPYIAESFALVQAEKAGRRDLASLGRKAALAIAALNWFPAPWNLTQAFFALVFL